MPNEQDDGSTMTTTSRQKCGRKSVNYANKKTSIISFMKGEIKLLPPELLKIIATKCLKNLSVQDIAQLAIIK